MEKQPLDPDKFEKMSDDMWTHPDCLDGLIYSDSDLPEFERIWAAKKSKKGLKIGGNNYKNKKKMRESRLREPKTSINLQEDLFSSVSLAEFSSYHKNCFGQNLEIRSITQHISAGFENLPASWKIKYLGFYYFVKKLGENSSDKTENASKWFIEDSN